MAQPVSWWKVVKTIHPLSRLSTGMGVMDAVVVSLTMDGKILRDGDDVYFIHVWKSLNPCVLTQRHQQRQRSHNTVLD